MLEKDFESEELAEHFMQVLTDEIASDEESPAKKARQLAMAMKNLDQYTIDNIFMALCGWTYDTLVDKAEKEMADSN
jgi:hypothetical protein